MRIFRETLTALAALVALALIGVMIAPGFLDWNSQRDRIAGLLADRIGMPVAITGDLRLSLLPVPEIDVEGLRLGLAERPLLQADRLTATLSLTSLAGGALRITSARADGATIDLETLPSLIAARQSGPSRPSQAGGLDRLDIKGLTLTRSGRALALPRLDALIEAPDLAGPFRLDLLDFAQARDLRLQIGRVEQGRARLKGVLEDRHLALRANIDGALALPAGTPPSGTAVPGFDGQIQIHGNPLIGSVETGLQIPVEGSFRLLADPDQAIADPITLSFGTGERAVQLTGKAFADLASAEPRLTIDLTGKRLDATPLLSPSERAADPDLLSRLQETLKGAGSPSVPISTELRLHLDQIQGHGIPVHDVNLVLDAGRSRISMRSFAATLPGSTRLGFQRAERAGPSLLDGRIALDVGDLAAFLTWLRKSEAPKGIPQRLALSTGLLLTRSGIELPGIFLGSDAGALSGSGGLRLPVMGRGPAPHLELRLNAGRFDARMLAAFDPLRPLPGLDVTAALTITNLVLDERVLGGLDVAIERDARQARIRHLRLHGADGEELTLSGTASQEATHLTGKLDAERMRPIAEIARALVPISWTEALLARAESLSPAILVGNLRIGGRDGDANWDVVADGRLGGSSITLRTQSTLKNDALAISLNAEIANEDGSRLMSQISAIPLSGIQSVPGRLKLVAQGDPRRQIVGTLEGALAGLDVKAEGRFRPVLERPVAGTITLASRDASVLHRALGAGTPFIARNTPANLKGAFRFQDTTLTLSGFDATLGENRFSGEIAFDAARGGQVAGQIKAGHLTLLPFLMPALGETPLLPDEKGWRKTGFGKPVRPLLTGDLWIEAATIEIIPGLVLQDPQFITRFAPDFAALEGFEARRGEERQSLSLSLIRKGDVIEASGKLRLARISLPGTTARASLNLPLAARGTSPEVLMASLGGAGDLHIEGLILPGVDAAALGRVAAMPIESFGALDENRVGGILDTELRRNDLTLPPLGLPLTVVNGLARLGGTAIHAVPGETGGASLTPHVTIDLPRLALEARLAIQSPNAPKGWRGALPEIGILWRGRLDQLASIRRQLLVSPLVNGLLAIQLQRDLERAEAFEADIRERAALLRRQKADAFMLRREGEIATHLREEAERIEAMQRELASFRRRQQGDAFQANRQQEIDRFERLAREKAALEALIRADAPSQPASGSAPLNLLPPRPAP